MEYPKHIYISLFSNSSRKIRPANMLAEFTIQLALRIELGSTDNCEVGLCEFSCSPKSCTLKPIEFVGETKSWSIVILLHSSLWVTTTSDVCGRQFIRQCTVTKLLRISITYRSKTVPSMT